MDIISGTKTVALLLVVVALVLQACGDGSGSGGGICDRRSVESTCYEYTSKDLAAAVCLDAITGASPCPSASRVGSCSIATLQQTVSFYSTGGQPYDATSAQRTCSGLGGTYAPG